MRLVAERGGPDEPGDHALGRSRGGFATKLHLLTDGNGNPLGFHLTGGQVHDSTVLDIVMMTAIDMCDGDGNPVAWPVAVGGDKGYRAEWIDAYPLDLGIIPVIPSKENEDRNARPVEFDRELLPPTQHRRVRHRLAQGIPSSLLAIREDRQKLRRHDPPGVHPTMHAARRLEVVSKQCLVVLQLRF